jgi:hypothetical protein
MGFSTCCAAQQQLVVDTCELFSGYFHMDLSWPLLLPYLGNYCGRTPARIDAGQRGRRAFETNSKPVFALFRRDSQSMGRVGVVPP